MTRSVRLSSLGLMVLLAGALAFAACARVEARNPTAIPPTSTPEPENTPTPTFTPSPTPSPTPPSPTPSPEASPFPTATPSPTPLPVSNNGRYDLFLDLQGIGDESVIQGNIIIIRGQTSPAAILSVNGLIVQVDANGNFEAEIRLNPGANVIEVVASDLDGNQKSRVVAVVSLPEDEADTGGGA